MRIVQNNNVIEVTCNHCNSVLAITVEDIKDSMEKGLHVKCAACGKIVPVSTSQLPRHWIKLLDWE